MLQLEHQKGHCPRHKHEMLQNCYISSMQYNYEI